MNNTHKSKPQVIVENEVIPNLLLGAGYFGGEEEGDNVPEVKCPIFF